MDIYAEFLALLDKAIEKCGNAKKLAEALDHPGLPLYTLLLFLHFSLYRFFL